MIKIQIRRKGRFVTVDVTGHADAAEHGRDVICAGVSTLVLTLCETLRSIDAYGFACTLNAGCAHIEFSESRRTRMAVKTVLCGFEMLAGSYPQYIALSVTGFYINNLPQG